MKYRRDIDGLRALAVLPVIFYHADFHWFSGGYLGVDVFFVISGFLITRLILEELQTMSFSLSGFYERRARRILPALLLVSLITVPFAWLWLPAEHFLDFAESLAAIAVLSPNVLFWSESGYFDAASELKPLIHTWSLGVEEQFYLLFPLLILALHRVKSISLSVCLASLAVVSLSLAQHVVYRDPAAGFFLLPFRGWELLAGSLCAVKPARLAGWPARVADAAAAVGLVTLAGCFLAYDQSVPTPSLATAIPVAATALILLSARPDTLTSRFLGLRPLVNVGLVSYSLYLWHQPLFALYRHVAPENADELRVKWLLILLATALAYATWRFVEIPFRNKAKVETRRVLVTGMAGLASLVLLGLTGYIYQGFPRTPLGDTQLAARLKKEISPVMLVGDSHAGHLEIGLQNAADGRILNRSSTGCIPFLGLDRYDALSRPGACLYAIRSALDEFVVTPDVRNLVLASMGPVYLDGSSFRNQPDRRTRGLVVAYEEDATLRDPWLIFELSLRRTLETLQQHPERNVVLALDVPELGFRYGCNVQKKVMQVGTLKIGDLVDGPLAEHCRIPLDDYIDRASRYRALVKRVAREFPNTDVFDPMELFCDDSWCYGYLEEVGFLYKDPDHLSEAGSTYVAKHLIEHLY